MTETRIQFLVENDRNRRLLGSFVDEWATPVVDDRLQDVDLYLVDEASLPRYREALHAHKRERYPVFCPVVLLHSGETEPPVASTDPDDGAVPTETPLLIDETLSVPVEKRVLARRLRNLLVRRQQTLELEEKTERLERFASKLSHELRNPLSILDAYLPVARDHDDAAAFDRCEAAIDRLDGRISDMLSLARDGETPIDPRPVSLPAVVDDSWAAVDGSPARLEIRLRRRNPEGEGNRGQAQAQVLADEDRLRALLENLFRNAIEHGGDDVTVRVGDVDGGFYVEDDGAGIPDDGTRVFEEGHTTAERGAGFGLSVVEDVVRAHGWEIRLTDGSAGGARFEITGVEAA